VGAEQYRFRDLNRFVALENLDAKLNIDKALETVRESITISVKEGLGYYELKS
jgi:hypothetical protein